MKKQTFLKQTGLTEAQFSGTEKIEGNNVLHKTSKYAMMTKLMSQIPPKQETPKGQKFHIGEIVKISNPESWFSRNSFEKDKERLYEIEYSYFQKYGGNKGRQTKAYSLKHLFEDNSSAWYEEAELELVKSITEINEERDLSEYQRLKAKYEAGS